MTPGARSDQVGPIVVDAAGAAWLAVRVRAAAEQGRANEAVRQCVADALHIALHRVVLHAGTSDRRKRLVLDAVDTDRLEALLPAWSPAPGGR